MLTFEKMGFPQIWVLIVNSIIHQYQRQAIIGSFNFLKTGSRFSITRLTFEIFLHNFDESHRLLVRGKVEGTKWRYSYKNFQSLSQSQYMSEIVIFCLQKLAFIYLVVVCVAKDCTLH